MTIRTLTFLFIAALTMVASVSAQAQGDGTAAPASIVAETATSLRIVYQGRLLVPATGQPKPDGQYAMAFRIYDAQTGGNMLWQEMRTGLPNAPKVQVTRGAFAVELGEYAALNPAHFDSRDLWLGITVEGDAEMPTRIRLAWVPYALYARTAANADKLDNQDSSAFYKGNFETYIGDSCSQLGAIAPGAVQTWWFIRGSSGFPPEELNLWQARAKTEGARLESTTGIELLPGGGGTLRYWVVVKNAGSITTCYSIVRYRLVQ